MKDFIEILDFCGYDLDRAHELAQGIPDWMEEALADAGLETLSKQSLSEERR